MNSFDKVFKFMVNTYPGLFSAATGEDCFFLVAEHIFNVLGTGSDELPFADLPDYDIIPLGNEKPMFEAHQPYPNFMAYYSMVYATLKHQTRSFDEWTENWTFTTLGEYRFADLPKDWREAAKLYYTRCEAYFSDEYACRHYSHGFNKFAPAKQVAHWTKVLEGKSAQSIKKDYGTPFNGDVADFLQRKWDKERNRIIKFCAYTVKLLEEMP